MRGAEPRSNTGYQRSAHTRAIRQTPDDDQRSLPSRAPDRAKSPDLDGQTLGGHKARRIPYRPGSGLTAVRVRASDVAATDFPAGLTVARPCSLERQTPRRPHRPRAAARRARPPPS